jgi:hypothetical protein
MNDGSVQDMLDQIKALGDELISSGALGIKNVY